MGEHVFMAFDLIINAFNIPDLWGLLSVPTSLVCPHKEGEINRTCPHKSGEVNTHTYTHTPLYIYTRKGIVKLL